MLRDIVKVQSLGDYRLRLEFEDGVAGELNLADILDFRGVFAPLKDPAEFAKVEVHPELGTIFWPNGVDLDPDVLYSRLTGEPIEIRAPAGGRG